MSKVRDAYAALPSVLCQSADNFWLMFEGGDEVVQHLKHHRRIANQAKAAEMVLRDDAELMDRIGEMNAYLRKCQEGAA